MADKQLTDEYVLYHPAFSIGKSNIGMVSRDGGQLTECLATNVTPCPYAYSRNSQELQGWFRNCYANYNFSHPLRWSNPQGFVFPLLDVGVTNIPVPTKDGGMRMHRAFTLSPLANENPYWTDFAAWEFTGTIEDVFPRGRDYGVDSSKIVHRRLPGWPAQAGVWVIPDIFAKLWLKGNGTATRPQTVLPAATQVAPVVEEVNNSATIIGGKVILNLTGKAINIKGKRAPSNGLVSIVVEDGKVAVKGLPDPTPGIVYYVPPAVIPLLSGREDVKAGKK